MTLTQNIYINMHTHIHIYMNSCAHIYAQKYIYKHTDIYVHTETHTAYIPNKHTYMQLQKNSTQTNITLKYP